MASSFIDIKEIGFWAGDCFVEAIILCLISEIEESKIEKSEFWITEYKNSIALESLPLIYGGMSLRLEEFISSEKRIIILTEMIDSIIGKIKSDKNYLTGSNFHSFRKRAMKLLWEVDEKNFENENDLLESINDSRWNESTIHQAIESYINGFILLKKLINGKLETTASSTINYWS